MPPPPCCWEISGFWYVKEKDNAHTHFAAMRCWLCHGVWKMLKVCQQIGKICDALVSWFCIQPEMQIFGWQQDGCTCKGAQNPPSADVDICDIYHMWGFLCCCCCNRLLAYDVYKHKIVFLFVQASVKKENGQVVMVPLFLGQDSVAGEVSSSSETIFVIMVDFFCQNFFSICHLNQIEFPDF